MWQPLLTISWLGKGTPAQPDSIEEYRAGPSPLCLLPLPASHFAAPSPPHPPCPQRSHIPPPQDFFALQEQERGGEMRSHARSRRRCRAFFRRAASTPPDGEKNRNRHRCMHAHGPVCRRRLRMPSAPRKFGPTLRGARYEARKIPNIGAWPGTLPPPRARRARFMEAQRSPSPVVATEQCGFRLRSWTARES